MSKFTKCNNFELVSGTRYILNEDVSWDIGVINSGWVLYLPKGFEFDISVPKQLTWVLDPHDRMVLLAAAVHDKLLIQRHDAAFASSEFRRACRARGVKNNRAWVLFFSTFIWTFKVE